jgi:hypothetical protein
MSMSAGVLILLVSAAHAQPADDEIFTHLLGARSVRCDFETGTHGSWDSGRLKLERAAWGKGNTMTVDSIDIKEGTARLIANVGAGDVRVLMTPTGLTFVEETALGSLNFTTVFGSYGPSRRLIAVTSRHMSTFSGPFPSQYHVTCSILDEGRDPLLPLCLGPRGWRCSARHVGLC